MEQVTWDQLLGMWNWRPQYWVPVVAVVALYLACNGPWRARFKDAAPVSGRQLTLFLLGAGTILFALLSPLDEIGDEYLFSAHMIQHLLLTLIAAPLMLMGTPAWLLRAPLRYPPVRAVARVLTHPIVAFATFNLVFMLWHLPGWYEAALQSEAVHFVEHASFFGTALLNWWPVLSPLAELPGLPPAGKILYLFLESIPSTVLGALITFSPDVLYPTYAAAPQLPGYTAIADQQMAGLIMWMPGGMVYLVAITIVFYGWINREDRAKGNKNRNQGLGIRD